MTLLVSRSLAFLLSLLVALPPGWCCYFATDGCCPETPVSDQAPSPEKPVPSCCHQESKQANDHPTPPRSPTPIRKCCEATVATSALAEKSTLDFQYADLFIPSIVSLTEFESGPACLAPPDTIVPSKRLHLLRCVWLC